MIKKGGSLYEGVEGGQIVKVLEALLVSPVLGFVGALFLYRIIRMLFKDEHLELRPEPQH